MPKTFEPGSGVSQFDNAFKRVAVCS